MRWNFQQCMCVRGRKKEGRSRERGLFLLPLLLLLYIFIRLLLLLLCIYKRWNSKGRMFQSIGGGEVQPREGQLPHLETFQNNIVGLPCPLGMRRIGRKTQREKNGRKQELNTLGKRPCSPLSVDNRNPHTKQQQQQQREIWIFFFIFLLKSFRTPEKLFRVRLLFHMVTQKRLHRDCRRSGVQSNSFIFRASVWRNKPEKTTIFVRHSKSQ